MRLRRPNPALLPALLPALTCALSLATSPVHAQATDGSYIAPSLVLRGVNVLEGPDLQPRLGVSIVIEGGRIARIGPRDGSAPDGARIKIGRAHV